MLAVFGASFPKKPVLVQAQAPSAAGLWVDLSNHNGPLTDAICDEMRAGHVVGVCVQAITGLDGISWTRQQLQKAQERGLRIAGYVWCFGGSSVAGRLRMFDGFRLEWLALDVEDDTADDLDVDRDLALCDAYTGQLTEFYTGAWFFARKHWTALARWSNRKLWAAIYDDDSNPDSGFVPFGGWDQCYTKQFTDRAVYGGMLCDLNFRRGT